MLGDWKIKENIGIGQRGKIATLDFSKSTHAQGFADDVVLDFQIAGHLKALFKCGKFAFKI